MADYSAIQKLYRDYLWREANPSELESWYRQIGPTIDADEFTDEAQMFYNAARPELQSRAPASANQMYQDVLGRAPSQRELNDLTGRIVSGGYSNALNQFKGIAQPELYAKSGGTGIPTYEQIGGNPFYMTDTGEYIDPTLLSKQTGPYKVSQYRYNMPSAPDEYGVGGGWVAQPKNWNEFQKYVNSRDITKQDIYGFADIPYQEAVKNRTATIGGNKWNVYEGGEDSPPFAQFIDHAANRINEASIQVGPNGELQLTNITARPYNTGGGGGFFSSFFRDLGGLVADLGPIVPIALAIAAPGIGGLLSGAGGAAAAGITEAALGELGINTALAGAGAGAAGAGAAGIESLLAAAPESALGAGYGGGLGGFIEPAAATVGGGASAAGITSLTPELAAGVGAGAGTIPTVSVDGVGATDIGLTNTTVPAQTGTGIDTLVSQTAADDVAAQQAAAQAQAGAGTTPSLDAINQQIVSSGTGADAVGAGTSSVSPGEVDQFLAQQQIANAPQGMTYDAFGSPVPTGTPASAYADPSGLINPDGTYSGVTGTGAETAGSSGISGSTLGQDASLANYIEPSLATPYSAGIETLAPGSALAAGAGTGPYISPGEVDQTLASQTAADTTVDLNQAIAEGKAASGVTDPTYEAATKAGSEAFPGATTGTAADLLKGGKTALDVLKTAYGAFQSADPLTKMLIGGLGGAGILSLLGNLAKSSGPGPATAPRASYTPINAAQYTAALPRGDIYRTRYAADGGVMSLPNRGEMMVGGGGPQTHPMDGGANGTFDWQQRSDPTSRMAAGGISHLGSYSDGGRMLKGPGDGMSDNIPATIAGKQPARLADGEFVIPADVVSHLGNGSTDAGAKQLYAMMDRVRKARTGTKKQGKQIKPQKFMPV